MVAGNSVQLSVCIVLTSTTPVLGTDPRDVVMFLFGLGMISLGSLLPALTSKFGLSDVTAGSLASLLPFGILSGSVIFGPVVDRYGYRVLMSVSTLSLR